MVPSSIQRIFAVFLALLLGLYFIVQPARTTWTNYWLTKDAQQGKAVVTRVLWTGHNGVAYRYRVNQNEYTGKDAAKYNQVIVGAEPVVFFSASHPWLSRLSRPKTAMVEGLPVLLLVWFLIALFIITAINPKHKWALNFGMQQARSGTSQ